MNKSYINTATIFVGLFIFFYIFRVWKTYTFSGEWHYNLFAYYGVGKLLVVVGAVFIAFMIGKLNFRMAYRDLFRHELEPGEIDKIRKSTNGNFVLGTKRFEEEISAMLGRRVSPGKAGRPRIETIANKPK